MATSIPQAEGWRASVKRLRRLGRTILNHLLVRITGTPEAKRLPLADNTRRILVVRLNKRLGNTLFLTPMLHALNAGLPGAVIDILIRDQRQAPLLANLPGVRRVHAQPTSARALACMLSELRQQHYDLVIDPSTNSTGNRIAIALVGARQRLGFASPDQWLRLTHAAEYPASRHQAQQGVALLTGGIAGPNFGRWPHLAVHPSVAAQTEAESHWLQALDFDSSAPVIGFFTRATGAKQLQNDWWQAWLARVRERAPTARLLQIQPPGSHATLHAGVAGVQIAELDVLAALLGRLTVFVAADSGPMHLAAASGVATVGLFQATAAATYAPLGPNCAAINKQELTPDHVAQVTVERLAQSGD